MELKTYIDFKRQLADIQASAAITPDNCSIQTKQIDDISKKRNIILFEEGSGIRNSSDIVSNIISNSDHSNRKRMKIADQLSPLSLPQNHADNNINSNSCNNSVISSSNSSINTNTSNNGDGASLPMNNNAPFPNNTWWKKGNERICLF